MRTRIAVLLALLLFALPTLVRAEEYPIQETLVKVKLLGLSADRKGVQYQVTVQTKKPIKSVEVDVNAYTTEDFLGATTLTWKPGSALSMGKTYDVIDRTMFKKQIPKDDKFEAQMGVIRVNFTDGTWWTSSGKYGMNGAPTTSSKKK